MFRILVLVFLCLFSFPDWMKKVKGKQVGWKCQHCGKRFAHGWLLEFHHVTPTSAGGEDSFDNMECLCVECHYHAHLYLRSQGLDHPMSAQLVKRRLEATGGRTEKWRKKNGWN